MNIRKFLISAVMLSVFVLPSCKKEDKEEAAYKNSFTGSFVIDLPEFVSANESYTLVPAGLSREEKDKGIGYIWDCPAMGINKDTTRVENDPLDKKGEIVLHVKDTLGVFRISLTAFADGYYNTMKGLDYIIVNPVTSLVIETKPVDALSFTDPRDGHEYPYKKMGGKDWMLSNLAYAQSGVSFHKCKAMDAIYGRYYKWTEAMAACPEGWRLPTEADWNAMLSVSAADAKNPAKGVAGALMAKATFNHDILWEFWPEVKITNSSSMTILPAGYVQYLGSEPRFYDPLKYAAFWSADLADEEQAIYHYLYMKNVDLMVSKAHKESFAATVRCVRD